MPLGCGCTGGIDPAIERNQRQATGQSGLLRLLKPIARVLCEAQTPIWAQRFAAKAVATMYSDIFPRRARCPRLFWGDTVTSRPVNGLAVTVYKGSAPT